MKTDVIRISGGYTENALDQAERMAAYKGLSPKNALHLRLLTEEMMGMMRSITGETEGEFWIEDDQNEYRLHLKVNTRMNTGKRDQLLAASTTGKNESAKGLMGRLRDFFDRGADEDIAALTNPLMMHEMYEHTDSTPTLDMEWSLIRYEDLLRSRIGDDAAAREAWDELEKSVVTHVADDVKVSIRNDTAEMIIIKKMA